MQALKRIIPRSNALITKNQIVVASFSNTFKEKERGEEKLFFSRNDEKLLKNLLKKVQHQSDTVETDAERIQRAEKELSSICRKYKITANKNLVSDLFDWKY